MSWTVLSGAFLVGLLGGAHCMAMCGGIVMAVGQRQSARVALLRRVSPARLWAETLVLHAGRISTYAIAGAIAGGLGSVAWRQSWLPLQRGLFLAGGAMLALYGLALLARAAGSAPVWRFTLLEVWLARGWRRVLDTVRQGGERRWQVRLMRHPLATRYAGGLAWGLVPCGMSIGMLGLALLAGNALAGGATMLAFGLGTLPNLVAMSGLLGLLRRLAGRPAWRIAGALAVTAAGMAAVYMAILLPETLRLQGFCLSWTT
ncbi:sulfite exporter TauE/SafE family protein [Pigmentiphaga soli]|uniref:sulfite exporter TauE/SafE family protein n=1 Tax=Pigmentiphaga soli TaxID=1007095 RepID=UPI003CD08525